MKGPFDDIINALGKDTPKKSEPTPMEKYKKGVAERVGKVKDMMKEGKK